MTVHWEVLEDPFIIARLVIQVFLFAASALFSMSETALFSLRQQDLLRLESQNRTKAQRLRSLVDEPRQLIVSILCGNELINIAATVNLTGILLALLGDPQTAALVNTAVMLPMLLVFGEITPKTLAVTRPVMLSTRVIEPVITPWVWLVMPLRTVVRFASDKVTRLFVDEEHGQKNILGADEFRTLLSDVEQEGIVNAAERRVILNLIEAGSTPVTQIMVPRSRVAFIDGDLPAVEIIEALEKAPGPQPLEALLNRLNVKGEQPRRGIENRLKAMVRDGQLVRNRRGCYALVDPFDLVQWRVIGHPDGFGFLVPRQEGLRLLGALWTSTLFPERAPEGDVLMRVMIGGARDPEVLEPLLRRHEAYLDCLSRAGVPVPRTRLIASAAMAWCSDSLGSRPCSAVHRSTC